MLRTVYKVDLNRLFFTRKYSKNASLIYSLIIMRKVIILYLLVYYIVYVKEYMGNKLFKGYML